MRDQRQNEQKPYYSGKKKVHTFKTQIAVRPDGHIEAVSASVPGGANHDLNLLRQSKLLDQLAEGEEAMLDKGCDEIQKDYNRLVSRYRIVVEHSLAPMSRFQVLSQIYRHSH